MSDVKQKTAAIATTMLLSLPAVLPVGACGTPMADALGWNAAYGCIEKPYLTKKREEREREERAKQTLLVVAGSGVGVIGAGVAVGVGIRHSRNKKRNNNGGGEAGDITMENTTDNPRMPEDGGMQ